MITRFFFCEQIIERNKRIKKKKFHIPVTPHVPLSRVISTAWWFRPILRDIWTRQPLTSTVRDSTKQSPEPINMRHPNLLPQHQPQTKAINHYKLPVPYIDLTTSRNESTSTSFLSSSSSCVLLTFPDHFSSKPWKLPPVSLSLLQQLSLHLQGRFYAKELFILVRPQCFDLQLEILRANHSKAFRHSHPNSCFSNTSNSCLRS